MEGRWPDNGPPRDRGDRGDRRNRRRGGGPPDRFDDRDRSLRSVFVGNVPYNATDEDLVALFSEVGHVVSLRMVNDRETGKPKGFGFCEFESPEIAVAAIRRMNGREIHGRQLRLDSAASERDRDDMFGRIPIAPVSVPQPSLDNQFIPQAPPMHGDAVAPEDAPGAITKAVASLPPEQMFQLMKQMKVCIKNSPEQARQMLIQNPQLAYALLQAQVVMHLVDPQVAQSLLIADAEQAQATRPETSLASVGPPSSSGGPAMATSQSANHSEPMPMDRGPPPTQQSQAMHSHSAMSAAPMDNRPPAEAHPARPMDHHPMDLRPGGPMMDCRPMDPPPHHAGPPTSRSMAPPTGPMPTPMYSQGPPPNEMGGPDNRHLDNRPPAEAHPARPMDHHPMDLRPGGPMMDPRPMDPPPHHAGPPTSRSMAPPTGPMPTPMYSQGPPPPPNEIGGPDNRHLRPDSREMERYSPGRSGPPLENRGPPPLDNRHLRPDSREMEHYSPGRSGPPLENRGPPPPDNRGPPLDNRGPMGGYRGPVDGQGPPPPIDSHLHSSRPPPPRGDEALSMAPRSQAHDSRGQPRDPGAADRPPGRPSPYPSGPEYRGPPSGPQRSDAPPVTSSGGMPLDAGDSRMPRGGYPRSQDPRSAREMDNHSQPPHLGPRAENRGPSLASQPSAGLRGPPSQQQSSTAGPSGHEGPRGPRRGSIAGAPPVPSSSASLPTPTGVADDQEKAQLIMQVLSLTDEQIALLSTEQRQSVMLLREQLGKAT